MTVASTENACAPSQTELEDEIATLAAHIYARTCRWLELVAELREHDGLTVLSAMHELTLAAQYADRLLLLSDGRLVAVGAPEEIATEELISTHYRAEVRVYSDGQGPVAVIPVRKGKRL